MKVEVKWLNGRWNAFMPDHVLLSAGVGEITDLVEAAWPPLEPGRTIQWTAVQNPPKFVVRDVDAAEAKMSKSDR